MPVRRWRPDIGFGGFFIIYWWGIPLAASVFISAPRSGPTSILIFAANTFVAWQLAEVTLAWWRRGHTGPGEFAGREPRWVSRLERRRQTRNSAFQAARWAWFMAVSFAATAVVALNSDWATDHQHHPARLLFELAAVAAVVGSALTAYWWKASAPDVS